MIQLKKILLPTLVALFVGMIIMKVEEYIQIEINKKNYEEASLLWSFMGLMLGVFFYLGLIIIQICFVLPILKWFKKNNRKISLSYFVTILSVLTTIFTALFLCEKKFGFSDLLYGVLTIFPIYIGYWIANILVINKIERINGY